jgi:hypothetical protein
MKFYYISLTILVNKLFREPNSAIGRAGRRDWDNDLTAGRMTMQVIVRKQFTVYR